jgi:hypothetical protein
MDNVKTNIASSRRHRRPERARTGTKLTITLPITLSIVSAQIVDVGRRTYAVPLPRFRRPSASTRRACGTSMAGGDDVAGHYAARSAGYALFRIDVPPGPRRQIVHRRSRRLAGPRLVVDQALVQQDIVSSRTARPARECGGSPGRPSSEISASGSCRRRGP